MPNNTLAIVQVKRLSVARKKKKIYKSEYKNRQCHTM